MCRVEHVTLRMSFPITGVPPSHNIGHHNVSGSLSNRASLTRHMSCCYGISRYRMACSMRACEVASRIGIMPGWDNNRACYHGRCSNGQVKSHPIIGYPNLAYVRINAVPGLFQSSRHGERGATQIFEVMIPNRNNPKKGYPKEEY